jgi:hypothetical protein
MNRRNHAITLLQAAQDSPTMAGLVAVAMESSDRLNSIQALIPVALRSAIKAGPIEGRIWCLIVDTNAAAAKTRQLLPSLTAHLRAKGWDVESIRLRIFPTHSSKEQAKKTDDC